MSFIGANIEIERLVVPLQTDCPPSVHLSGFKLQNRERLLPFDVLLSAGSYWVRRGTEQHRKYTSKTLMSIGGRFCQCSRINSSGKSPISTKVKHTRKEVFIFYSFVSRLLPNIHRNQTSHHNCTQKSDIMILVHLTSCSLGSAACDSPAHACTHARTQHFHADNTFFFFFLRMLCWWEGNSSGNPPPAFLSPFLLTSTHTHGS